jgi:hypothetical protein
MATEDKKTEPIKETDKKEEEKKGEENKSSGSKEMYPSVDDVAEVCTWAEKSSIAKFLPPVINKMAELGMTSKNQLIGVVATIHTECMWEGSLKESGAVDGVTYGPGHPVGRGLTQLTWSENYIAAGKALGIDLIGNPDLALEPNNSVGIFFWYYTGTSGGSEDIRPFAEKGDWENVRSIVNKGSSGKYHLTTESDKYMPTIERGLAVFKQGISATGVISGSDDYDTGNGSNVTLAGQHNPMSQLSALEYALGLMMMDYHKAMQLEAYLDVAAQPDILKLDAQLTFEAKGFGEESGLDDTYTVEEVLFVFGDRLTAELKAYKPNPDAPRPMVFAGDASKPLAATTNKGSSAIASGPINQRILENTKKNKGADSSAGPGGGNVACAWCVNKYSVVPSGLPGLGGGQAGSDYVPTCVEDMEAGRADSVALSSIQPGDIWISFDMAHIGVVIEGGMVLSNSSSRASYDWVATVEEYRSFYGGTEHGFFRLKK